MREPTGRANESGIAPTTPRRARITSSGETLRANNLKILDGALIHPSQATLFAARSAVERPDLRALLTRLGLRAPGVETV